MKLLFGLFAIFLFVGCTRQDATTVLFDAPSPQTKTVLPLTERQAVEFAEKFIADNGYTDLPADQKNFTHESIESDSNTAEILKSRFKTLENKAFGISRGRRSQQPGWTVVFRYRQNREEQSKKNGRAVTMDIDGTNPRVEHVDFILEKVEKKLLSRTDRARLP